IAAAKQDELDVPAQRLGLRRNEGEMHLEAHEIVVLALATGPAAQIVLAGGEEHRRRLDRFAVEPDARPGAVTLDAANRCAAPHLDAERAGAGEQRLVEAPPRQAEGGKGE